MPDITLLGQVMAKAVAPYEEPQNSVRSRAVATPPPSAALGDRYLVPSGAAGVWAGHMDAIATYTAVGAGWAFHVPTTGTTCWVDDEKLLAAWDGAAWTQIQGGDNTGGSGPSVEDSYTADEPLSALRVVRISSFGHVVYARPPELAARAPIGVTTHAADVDASVVIATRNELSDASWHWTPGVPVLLGPNGTLVQPQPVGLNVLVAIGTAVATDTIVIRIAAPIDLAPGG